MSTNFIESMTLREVNIFETTTGKSIAAFGSGDAFVGEALATLVWLAKKREDAKYTREMAFDLTQAEAIEVLGMGDGSEDPKD